MTNIFFSEGKAISADNKIAASQACCDRPVCCACTAAFQDYELTVVVDLVLKIPNTFECAGEYQMSATLEYFTPPALSCCGGYFWPVELSNGNTAGLMFAIDCRLPEPYDPPNSVYALICVYYNYDPDVSPLQWEPQCDGLGFAQTFSDNPSAITVLDTVLDSEGRCVYTSHSKTLTNPNGCSVEYTITVE